MIWRSSAAASQIVSSASPRTFVRIASMIVSLKLVSMRTFAEDTGVRQVNPLYPVP